MVKTVFPAFFLLWLSFVVHSFDITVSTPQQCDSLQISWTGSSISAVQLKFPLSLHILPFSSTAVISPISKQAWNASMTSGSLSVPFTLRSGTQFLVAVLGSNGEAAGPVSDIKTVAGSRDTSCLSTDALTPTHFTVQTTSNSSACPSLTVSWDGSVKSQRPTIRAFSPGMLPIDLDPSVAAAPLDRVVSSIGNFTSKSEVVVSFHDKGSEIHTSQLLTVGGTDAACSSPSSSTNTSKPSMSITPPDQTAINGQEGSHVSNKSGIIVGAVAASIIGVAVILFAIFAYRQRRYRRARGLISHRGILDSPGLLPMRHSFSVLPSFPMPPSRPPPIPPLKSPWAVIGSNPDRTRPTSSSPRPSPAPPAKSPSLSVARRRSYVGLSPTVSSSPSQYVYFNDVESVSHDEYRPRTRPDSTTLPDPTFLRQFADPATPVTPPSGRLEQHVQYVPYAGDTRSPAYSGNRKAH